jgi:hypothetical protein
MLHNGPEALSHPCQISLSIRASDQGTLIAAPLDPSASLSLFVFSSFELSKKNNEIRSRRHYEQLTGAPQAWVLLSASTISFTE